MIVDSSAVLAVVFQEDDAERFSRALTHADECRISAVNFVEASVVFDMQNKSRGPNRFDAFWRQAGISIEAVSEEQAHAARQAYYDYGKGVHPAGLNLADCFAYALAKVSGEPLLFKGNDFTKTDVESAL